MRRAAAEGRRRRLVVVLVLATLLAACSGSDDTGSGDGTADRPAERSDRSGSTTSTGPATTAAPAPDVTVPAPGSTYVALGDSFASGGPAPTVIDSPCFRSDHNYAHLVARKLDLRLTDVTCSGATTANLLDTSQGDRPPQIQAIPGDTDLVTLTIGSNDLRYARTIYACGNGEAPDCDVPASETTKGLADLRTALDRVFDAIAAKAPHARIVVVTYPDLVPDPDCGELDLPGDDAMRMADLGRRLRDVLVETATDHQASVADAFAAGDHGACARGGDRWIFGNGGVAYHPTPEGHVAMADLVVTTLEGP